MTSPGLRTGAATEGLNGMSCLTSRMCLALGDWTRRKDPGDSHSDFQAWLNSAWQKIVKPDPFSAQQTFPQAVSCPTEKFCAVAGDVIDSNGTRREFADQVVKPFD
jgi:hypothetical protein